MGVGLVDGADVGEGLGFSEGFGVGIAVTSVGKGVGEGVGILVGGKEGTQITFTITNSSRFCSLWPQ